MRKLMIIGILVAAAGLTGCEVETLSPQAAKMILANRDKNQEEFKQLYNWCRSNSIIGCWEVSEKRLGMYSKWDDDYIRERALLAK